MRVIAGSARGRQLRAPDRGTTRPTSDRTKEALFGMLDSILGVHDADAELDESPWASRAVLDLYAGSGALGIEALSRGAPRADFVDSDRRCQATIRDNLDRTGFAGRGSTHVADATAFLARAATRRARTSDRYGVIFADAPYATSDDATLVAALAGSGLLAPGCLIALERSARAPEVDWQALTPSTKLTALRERRHGSAALVILQYDDQPGRS